MWNLSFAKLRNVESPALTVLRVNSKHTSTSHLVQYTSINLFHITQKRTKSHISKTIALITRFFDTIFLSFPICRSVERLLLSMVFQKETGTLAHMAQGANCFGL